MAEMKMVETLDQQRCSPPQLSKRKPHVESAAGGSAEVETKKRKPDGAPDRLPLEAGGEGERDQQKEEEEEGEEVVIGEVKDDGVHFNGEAAVAPVDRGKGVLTAVDKGKGKMVVEDDDDGDGSDDDDIGVVLGEEEYESDVLDDPLAEVDLSNMIPYRNSRRDLLLPGEYVVDDRDDERR